MYEKAGEKYFVLDDRVIMFANPEDAAEYIDFDLKEVVR